MSLTRPVRTYEKVTVSIKQDTNENVTLQVNNNLVLLDEIQRLCPVAEKFGIGPSSPSDERMLTAFAIAKEVYADSPFIAKIITERMIEQDIIRTHIYEQHILKRPNKFINHPWDLKRYHAWLETTYELYNAIVEIVYVEFDRQRYDTVFLFGIPIPKGASSPAEEVRKAIRDYHVTTNCFPGLAEIGEVEFYLNTIKKTGLDVYEAQPVPTTV